MKYAIIKVVNGNYTIEAEGYTSLESAIMKFHDVCKILWNAADVRTAHVIIADEQLDAMAGYKEFIHHEA